MWCARFQPLRSRVHAGLKDRKRAWIKNGWHMSSLLAFSSANLHEWDLLSLWANTDPCPRWEQAGWSLMMNHRGSRKRNRVGVSLDWLQHGKSNSFFKNIYISVWSLVNCKQAFYFGVLRLQLFVINRKEQIAESCCCCRCGFHDCSCTLRWYLKDNLYSVEQINKHGWQKAGKLV